jgi:hypothetical protein
MRAFPAGVVRHHRGERFGPRRRLPCGPASTSPGGARSLLARLTAVSVVIELRGLLRVALGFSPGTPVVRHQEQLKWRGPEPHAPGQQALLDRHNRPALRPRDGRTFPHGGRGSGLRPRSKTAKNRTDRGPAPQAPASHELSTGVWGRFWFRIVGGHILRIWGVRTRSSQSWE